MQRSVFPRLLTAVAAAGLSAILLGSFSGANAGGGVLGTGISPSRMMIDEETDCLEALPDGLSVSGVSDDGQNVDLDVLVLLDGVRVDGATKLMGVAQRSYTPLGITLKATYQEFTLTGNDATEIIDQARTYFGGATPSGVDIVHVLTTRNIEDGGNKAVAGMADCIGGVKSDKHAFSVGEFNMGESARFGPVGLWVDMAARVTAHELGHLLGAHHHYANCVEGALNATESIEAATCTLMVNLADLAVTNFSTVNAAVVRAHAVDYAV